MNKLTLFLRSIKLSKKNRISIAKNLSYVFSFPKLEKRLKICPKKFFFKLSKYFYDFCENDPQQAADEILRHCNLKSVSIRIIHDLLDIPKELVPLGVKHSQDVLGKTYMLNKFQYSIYINRNYGGKLVAAILAHEISHVFVFYNEIQFRTNHFDKQKFQEQITDLLTIALGLGKLMLEGNSYYFMIGDIEYYGILGYLSPRVMNYAQALMRIIVKKVKKGERPKKCFRIA